MQQKMFTFVKKRRKKKQILKNWKRMSCNFVIIFVTFHSVWSISTLITIKEEGKMKRAKQSLSASYIIMMIFLIWGLQEWKSYFPKHFQLNSQLLYKFVKNGKSLLLVKVWQHPACNVEKPIWIVLIALQVFLQLIAEFSSFLRLVGKYAQFWLGLGPLGSNQLLTR